MKMYIFLYELYIRHFFIKSISSTTITLCNRKHAFSTNVSVQTANTNNNTQV